jgi:exodeoxyribonuclease VII large subunit
MFRSRNRELAFVPRDGAHVLARAEVSLFEARGDFQLIVHHLEEAGDGALRRAFDLLKQRLYAEGLFDPAPKKPLPAFPRRIGVITSPTGAALRDILSVLRRRFPALPVLIYPAPVQGQEAAPRIACAIDLASARRECDVLILARGGGSLEDLWAFNDEAVARAIHAADLRSRYRADRLHHRGLRRGPRAPTLQGPRAVSPDQTSWLQRLSGYASVCSTWPPARWRGPERLAWLEKAPPTSADG